MSNTLEKAKNLAYNQVYKIKGEKEQTMAKNYSWNPEEQFVLSGKEFETIYKRLTSFMTLPISPASIMMISESLKIIQEVFNKGIEEGKISEISFTPEITKNEQTQ